MNYKIGIIFTFIIFSVTGCDHSGNISSRSGSLDDDYVAEPISVIAKKYQPALTTSNEIVALISNSNYNEIYDTYFSNKLKSELSKKVFNEQMIKIESGIGKLINYKEMQWGFFGGERQGMNLIYSVKIAEHEKAMMKYLFIFEKDSPYNLLVGFSAKVRDSVSPPGAF